MRALLPRPPLEIGVVATLVSLATGGIVGVIAVLESDNAPASFATGFGIAVLVFLAGATIACGLACLRRERATRGALLGVLSACLAINLLVLAIWLEIDNEAYSKIAAIAFVWSLFALIALSLTLAVSPSSGPARHLYLAAVAAIVVAGALSAWLIATAGQGPVLPTGGDLGLAPGLPGDDQDLRALGASLVVLAVLWFAALATDRATRADPTPRR